MGEYLSFPVLLLAASLATVGCIELSPLPDHPDGSADGDTDSDADTDTDSDADDPYQWHTFFGSDARDHAYGAAVIDDGVFVTGESEDSWTGPLDEEPYNPHSGGSSDIVVMKTDLDGMFGWHAFYGSGGTDNYGRAIDGFDADLYVVGDSAGSWIGQSSQQPLNPHSGDSDVFVLKLSREGEYHWHTFLGSSVMDSGLAVIAQGDGVLVAGVSENGWNGPADQAPENPHSGSFDVFVAFLNGDGAYQWHTFFHKGGVHDPFVGIAEDVGGIYVSAIARSECNGPGDQPPVNGFHDSTDVLVFMLDESGQYVWHNYLGSNDFQHPYAIAAKETNVFVTGGSYDIWNGPGGQSPLDGSDIDNGAFVMALSSSGDYEWHSFYGGGEGRSIAVEGDDLFVAARPNNLWEGPAGEDPLNEYGGTQEPALLKLSTGGEYEWHSFYGEGVSNPDLGPSVSVQAGGNEFYLVAPSGDSWNGPAGQQPLNPYANGDDISIICLVQTGA